MTRGEMLELASRIIAERGAAYGDAAALMAALLHDVAEDTLLSVQQIEEQFGPEVSQLVDGVTAQLNGQKVMDELKPAGVNYAELFEHARAEVEALMAYSADVAGGRMNPSYVSMRPQMTVAQALAYLRLQASDRISIVYYAYVIDTDEHLLGVISFRDLMTAPSGAHVEDVMIRTPVSVHEEMDQEAEIGRAHV